MAFSAPAIRIVELIDTEIALSEIPDILTAQRSLIVPDGTKAGQLNFT